MKLVNPNIYGRKYATSVQNLERVSNVCRSDPSRGFHLGFLYFSATVRRNGNRATNVIFFFLPSEKMCIKKHRPASLASPSKHWWRNGGKVRGRSGNWSFWKRRGRRVSGLPYVSRVRGSMSLERIEERFQDPRTKWMAVVRIDFYFISIFISQRTSEKDKNYYIQRSYFFSFSHFPLSRSSLDG